ncbi:L-noviosyl transferase [Actinomadura rubteroloni]|uniref:L-noviosyl transferase n=1 Tax=Actinomadura rubteroloni TaxID=1926885 RepID=A0A2P4UCS6_9ACTN|nr:glycosyltransferase [Actinomadura rubteroloni]POM22836.1 L-noviosyl transferase [Actinomadura rubteroloni]
MRILVCTYPTASDIFSTVQLAWALRSAGHEVLYCGAGDGMREVAGAGLPYADIAPPGADLTAPFTRRAQRSGATGQLVWYRGGTVRESDVESAVELFGELSAMVAGGAVRLARDWRPDLVIGTDHQGSGPLVAAQLGIPLVSVSPLFAIIPDMLDRVRRSIADSYQENGVTGAPRKVLKLRQAPPSLNRLESDHRPMRHVPYNGTYAHPVNEWISPEKGRARVCVTLGTFVPKYDGMETLRKLMKEFGQVPATIVMALGDVDLSELGDVPDNVRLHRWIPLNLLLRTCDAIVHHGGSGTTFAALEAGLPQIVLPHGADQYFNASTVAERGVGVIGERASLTAGDIAAVLASRAAAEAAAEVRAEIAAMPAPARIAAEVEEFAR